VLLLIHKLQINSTQSRPHISVCFLTSSYIQQPPILTHITQNVGYVKLLQARTSLNEQQLIKLYQQEVQATIDISQSSLIREDCIKLVCTYDTPCHSAPASRAPKLLPKLHRPVASGLHLLISYRYRICIQSYHCCKHHVHWSKRKGLCSGVVTEEGSRKATPAILLWNQYSYIG
jgi:hypothetical protein